MRARRLRKKSRPLRPISSRVTVAAGCCSWKRCAPLMRLLLKAPASPLSLVIRTSKMRCSGRTARSGFCPASTSRAAEEATLASTLRSIRPYGRAAITRSWARRSLAAETIFMALVICCVFLTERIRRRMSIRLGIHPYFGCSAFGCSATKRALNSLIASRSRTRSGSSSTFWSRIWSRRSRWALSMKR